MSENLANKPLIEVIFELKWELKESPNGLTDPNYQILVGRFYDRIQETYSRHEQLLPPFIPEDMMAGVVQHRFRKEDDQDPIVQLGLGILTVNSTEGYKWETFKPEVIKIISIFYDSYPKKTDLKLQSISLRYLDAVDINLEETNIRDFLSQNLKINISLDPSLFEHNKIEASPLGLKLNFVFECNKPQGAIIFNLTDGKREEKDAIIWDYVVNSQKDHIPSFPDSAEDWLDDAHDVAHDWFFALVDGELLESFR